MFVLNSKNNKYEATGRLAELKLGAEIQTYHVHLEREKIVDWRYYKNLEEESMVRHWG